MATFYKGDEIKFAVKLEASGFDMDTDDFDIEVKSSNTSVKGYKNPPAGTTTPSLVIFKETRKVRKERLQVNGTPLSILQPWLQALCESLQLHTSSIPTQTTVYARTSQCSRSGNLKMLNRYDLS